MHGSCFSRGERSIHTPGVDVENDAG
jgi:hypothetical protein